MCIGIYVKKRENQASFEGEKLMRCFSVGSTAGLDLKLEMFEQEI